MAAAPPAQPNPLMNFFPTTANLNNNAVPALTGWENLTPNGAGGNPVLHATQPAFSVGQLRTHQALNADLGAVTVGRPGAAHAARGALNEVMKIIFFRNMNVTREDIAPLLANIATQAHRNDVASSIRRAKDDLQRRTWKHQWFLDWVTDCIPLAADRITYAALTVDGQQQFWESRVDQALVARVFSLVNMVVDINAAWNCPVWRRHLIICVAEAAFSMDANLVVPGLPLDNIPAMRQVYAHMRHVANDRFANRPGYDRVPHV